MILPLSNATAPPTRTLSIVSAITPQIALATTRTTNKTAMIDKFTIFVLLIVPTINKKEVCQQKPCLFASRKSGVDLLPFWQKTCVQFLQKLNGMDVRFVCKTSAKPLGNIAILHAKNVIENRAYCHALDGRGQKFCFKTGCRSGSFQLCNHVCANWRIFGHRGQRLGCKTAKYNKALIFAQKACKKIEKNLRNFYHGY